MACEFVVYVFPVVTVTSSYKTSLGLLYSKISHYYINVVQDMLSLIYTWLFNCNLFSTGNQFRRSPVSKSFRRSL